MTIIIICIFEALILYEVMITLFSMKRNSKTEYVCDKCLESFSVLIACHDEEEVIEDNLKALYSTDYPTDLVNIYVVADNCSDGTICICKSFNEHHRINVNIIEVNGGSKPKALNKGIEYLKNNNLWIDDNIVILDADNKVSSNMFYLFNQYHADNEILQCTIKSANNDSFIAKSFTSSFNTTTYSRQIARNNIGLSGSLSGTGFSIKREVFDEIGFEKCDTLTEDLEFSVLAIMKGYKIKYVEDVYVLNQHLDEFKPSLVQRVRWCRGHMQVSMKLSNKVFMELIRRPSLQLFDTLMFINSPVRTIGFTVISIIGILSGRYNIKIIAIISALIIIYNIGFSIYSNGKTIKYLFNQIHFSFFMYFAIIYGALTYKNEKWVKTKHKKLT